MSQLLNIANRHIEPAIGKKVLIKSEYLTDDIIKEILSVDKTGWKDVDQFAKTISFKNLLDLCYQLHNFLRTYVQYVEDPKGDQYVKRPSAVWASKIADCKSLSLFIGSCLKSLGIPYSYRFVSFGSTPRYTHVYIVAHGINKDILVDAVIPQFNYEKPYTFKKDFKMNGLYRIEGVSGKPGSLNLPDDISNLTDAQLEARIIKQRLEIEHEIVSGISGIGSAKAQQYRKSIAVMDAMIGAIDNHDQARAEQIINSVGEGIGKLSLKKLWNSAKKSVTKVVDQGKKVVTKAARAVTKVVTAPARLLAKGVLEVTLPKVAPLFLYLFINDKKIIEKLPSSIRNKRKKAEKLADFIVDAIGMKRNHFMGIVRNGIMKHYKESPEKVIARILKGKGISGIGVLPLVALLPLLTPVLKKIMSLFGKKGAPSFDATDVPDDSDGAELDKTASTDLVNDILNQKDAIDPGESLDTIVKNGKKTKSGSGIIPESGGRKLFGIC